MMMQEVFLTRNKFEKLFQTAQSTVFVLRTRKTLYLAVEILKIVFKPFIRLNRTFINIPVEDQVSLYTSSVIVEGTTKNRLRVIYR